MTKLFQVNLSGVLDVFANHLYSSKQVFVRELLQNAIDAITARKLKTSEYFSPAIHVELYFSEGQYELIFEDNGVGLTYDEVNTFLSSIGSSTKRGYFEESRDSFIGQFGIGLLSCFMVSEHITIITKSDGNKPIKWIGKIDGSYEISVLDFDCEVGTKVYLSANHGSEYLFSEFELASSLKKYGEILPVPIYFKFNDNTEILINKAHPIWEIQYPDNGIKRDAYLTYGRECFQLDFNEFIEVNLAKAQGIIYLLPMEVSPNSRNTHNIFLKNMLLSKEIDSILPRWAFFFKAVLNLKGIRPTASRENLYEDRDLELLRFEIGKIIKLYFQNLSKENPDKLSKIFEIHESAFKIMALEDDDFFDLIIHDIHFFSNKGRKKLSQIQDSVIYHIRDIDEFRKVSQISHSQEIIIINSAYSYDYQLLTKLKSKQFHKPIKEVDISIFFEKFGVLTSEEIRNCQNLLEIATIALEKFKCKPEIKRYSPHTLPALYYMSETVNIERSLDEVLSMTDSLWGGILDTFTTKSSVSFSVICLNYDNKLIQKLIKLEDTNIIFSVIELIYVNSLLLGHHPINSKEVEVLNNKLFELIDKAV